MSYRLPGLSLLRSFEAAARHLSFKKAAAELCITPAAVSQQIKALEEWLGVPLFHRLTRALSLTEQGQAMLPQLREGFANLAGAIDSARQPGDGALTVIAPPSFASHWLVPRLPRFARAHPEIELQLASTSEAVERHGDAAVLARLIVDPRANRTPVAILYGDGAYPGHRVDKLFTPEYVPVCAPAICAGAEALRAPADLVRHPLIHDDTLLDAGPGVGHRSGWAEWLARAGLRSRSLPRGPRFANAALALAAAQAGQGVALAPRALVHGYLADGSLVIPFDIALPSPYAYYLVAQEDTAQRRSVGAFRDWLIGEAHAALPVV